MKICPHSSLAIKRTLDVVRLVGDHLPDADDKIAKTFGRRPVVADADDGWFDVRMEDRCKHSTGRRRPRVGSGKFDFYFMVVAKHDAVSLKPLYAANPI